MAAGGINGNYTTLTNAQLFDPVTQTAIRVGDWTSLGLAAEISPGHYQVADSQAAQNPHRFFASAPPESPFADTGSNGLFL